MLCFTIFSVYSHGAFMLCVWSHSVRVLWFNIFEWCCFYFHDCFSLTDSYHQSHQMVLIKLVEFFRSCVSRWKTSFTFIIDGGPFVVMRFSYSFSDLKCEPRSHGKDDSKGYSRRKVMANWPIINGMLHTQRRWLLEPIAHAHISNRPNSSFSTIFVDRFWWIPSPMLNK